MSKKKPVISKEEIQPICLISFGRENERHLMRYTTQAPQGNGDPMMLLENVCGEPLVLLITLQRFAEDARVILKDTTIAFQTSPKTQNDLIFNGEVFLSKDDLPVQITTFSIACRDHISEVIDYAPKQKADTRKAKK